MSSDDRILLIRTGGTIESEPYPDPRNPPQDVAPLLGNKSLVMDTIRTLPNSDKVDEYIWGGRAFARLLARIKGDKERRYVVDSKSYKLDMIKGLADVIKKDKDHKYFMLTHGTDQMAKNAVLLQKELEGSGKVVVFVGAMVPLSMHKEHGDDAIETLQYALQNITRLDQGVHIVGRASEMPNDLKFFSASDFLEKNRSLSIQNLKLTFDNKSDESTQRR